MSAVVTALRLKKRSRCLEVDFEDGSSSVLGFEYLRVYSPSAEVRGHGPGQEILQTGKQDVLITAIEPVGQYGTRLIFDDGHDSGIYSWNYLRELSNEKQDRWQRYLQRLQSAGASRERS